MKDSGFRSRLLVLGGVAAVVAAAGATFYVGSALERPARREVRAPTDFAVEDVEFPSDSGATIRGWFAEGDPGRGGVLLLHAIRADRRSMLARARFLNAHGYAVLLIDFQAHGESSGERITWGYLEARDAHAAVELLRNRLPGEPVAAIGSSLGGVACLLGDEPLAVDALVVEAAYSTLERAVENRLRIRLGAVGPFLEPLLTVQMKPRAGIDVDRLRPIDRIGEIRAPLLLIAGENDRRTTVDESQALFEAAPEPKELWIVPDAPHKDLHGFAGGAYEARVLDFLERSFAPE